jgi:hypothetical protein
MTHLETEGMSSDIYNIISTIFTINAARSLLNCLSYDVLKWTMGVGRYISIAVIWGDTGRYPLVIGLSFQIFKFIDRLQQMESDGNPASVRHTYAEYGLARMANPLNCICYQFCDEDTVLHSTELPIFEPVYEDEKHLLQTYSTHMDFRAASSIPAQIDDRFPEPEEPERRQFKTGPTGEDGCCSKNSEFRVDILL